MRAMAATKRPRVAVKKTTDGASRKSTPAPAAVPALVIPAGEKDVECSRSAGAQVRLTNSQAVLAGARHHQGRPAAVLRRRRAGAAAAPRRPRDGDEALSERGGRRVLLHEARAVAAARVDRDCAIEHGSGSVIDFPMIQDLAALLWVVNLGCIDLNPWYARCDDVDRPDYLHFDLDPVPEATLRPRASRPRCSSARRSTAWACRRSSRRPARRGCTSTSPIVRGPTQKEVWTFAKAFARELAARAPGADHRRVPRRQAPARPRARRLQPERLGPHAGLGLLGAAAAARDRVDAGRPGRRSSAASRIEDFTSQRAGADRGGRRPVGAAAARRARPLRPRAAAALAALRRDAGSAGERRVAREQRARRAKRWSKSTGLTRCSSKPASSARRAVRSPGRSR